MLSRGTANEGDPDCTEVLEDNSKSILMGIISQLRKDMDLHRVTLPTFVLEPRSMLERVTDFMSHPDLLLEASTKTDPTARFLDVVRYFLSGWHIKPKGVKKPYNPVLGEFFRCKYQYSNGTEAIYIAEQVSHHPPISAFYYGSPENGIYIQGDLRPKSKFLGNSAATLMEGENHIIFTHLHNERYDISMPNVYARGILFGKMILELGDSCMVRCKSSDLVCELDFKTRGFFSGQYNSVCGRVKKESTAEILYEISGQWSNEIYIKMAKATNKNLFFDVKSSTIHPKLVNDLEKQEPMESRRLWSKVTSAILEDDMDTATAEKTSIEDKQREDTRKRHSEQREFTPKYFNIVNGDHIDYVNKDKGKAQLEDFVFSPSASKTTATVSATTTADRPKPSAFPVG
ncbi:hypothetical protein G6F57_004393 [Rhizopus arrhizus]|uniref:Oxysterol-binding protein n=1 Tax=Rhizopus oryzae TaxID=64495 RepID=A0A9P6X8U1_RHIOR|nr:hypothetical protein G6F23_001013 [Rhizopus arrhizus]KAG1421807.1 hypothetical protein G6F58_003590 [Rhizopus delemar]KAG0765871.1 hypothetical protein G6F24_004064 [Rhizopus arrhizus]KAG0792629.1 hypothetical protein G6F21_004213 [Rhizopus arrhizus]KAG0814350.1 hypothetical protein G6F20_004844 [Rhizopus arrhizus]